MEICIKGNCIILSNTLRNLKFSQILRHVTKYSVSKQGISASPITLKTNKSKRGFHIIVLIAYNTEVKKKISCLLMRGLSKLAYKHNRW